MFKKLFLWFLISLFVLTSALAFFADSTIYAVDATTIAQAGGVGESSEYSARTTTTALQETKDKGENQDIFADVGWLEKRRPIMAPHNDMLGKSYLVNETALIKAHIKDPDGLHTVHAEVTLPNGSVE